MYINLQTILTWVIAILLITLYLTHSVVVSWVLVPLCVLVLLTSLLHGRRIWDVEIGICVEDVNG